MVTHYQVVCYALSPLNGIFKGFGIVEASEPVIWYIEMCEEDEEGKGI